MITAHHATKLNAMHPRANGGPSVAAAASTNGQAR